MKRCHSKGSTQIIQIHLLYPNFNQCIQEGKTVSKNVNTFIWLEIITIVELVNNDSNSQQKQRMGTRTFTTMFVSSQFEMKAIIFVTVLQS